MKKLLFCSFLMAVALSLVVFVPSSEVTAAFDASVCQSTLTDGESYIVPDKRSIFSDAASTSIAVGTLDDGSIIVIDRTKEVDGSIWGHLADGTGWCILADCHYLSGSTRTESYITPSELPIYANISSMNAPIAFMDVGSTITVCETVQTDENRTFGRLHGGGWCDITDCHYLFGALYTLTYRLPEPQIVRVMTNCSLMLELLPEQDGKVFLGWAVYDGSSEPSYRVGDSIKVTQDTELYPVWGEPCEHEYLARIVLPTAAEYGYTLLTCQKCGESSKSDFVDSKGSLTEKAGRLILSAELTDAVDPTAQTPSVFVNGVLSDAWRCRSSVTPTDIGCRLECELFGLAYGASDELMIRCELGGHVIEVSYLTENSSIGYRDFFAVSRSDASFCSIALQTESTLSVGDKLDAVSDSRKSYEFEVDAVAGGRVVLVCRDYKTQEKTLCFESINVAVDMSASEDNAVVLSGDRDAVFSTCYFTSENADGTRDIRMIILLNKSLVRNIEYADVSITFYKGDRIVKRIVGRIGGDRSTYSISKLLYLRGMLYAAADGYMLFGQIITGVSSGSFERMSVRITDGISGELMSEATYSMLER